MQEISETELKLSNFFTEFTGVIPSLVVALNDAVAFVVDKRVMSKVLGRNGKNAEIMARKINKKVYIFADAKELEPFVRNLLSDVKIIALDINRVMDKDFVTAFIMEKDKSRVIGKNKARIRLTEELLKRKFNAMFYLRTKVI
ncbi:MAG: hypothetical protein QXI89_00075 [Candidatus Anstonellales archaeon]